MARAAGAAGRANGPVPVPLPLPSLRDTSGRLSHSLLPPDQEWPTSVPPRPGGTPLRFPAEAGVLRFDSPIILNERAATLAASDAASLAVHFKVCDSWSPCRWSHARGMFLGIPTAGGDDLAVAQVIAQPGESEVFWTLWQLCSVAEHAEHTPDWPKWWREVDSASTADCGDTRSVTHASCRMMKVASLHARLRRQRNGTGSAAGFVVEVTLCLEAGAFELDRRLEAAAEAGAEAGDFADEDEFEAAQLGERPADSRDVRKALRRLLQRLAADETSGLRHGPDTCVATMNRYGGVKREDVLGSDAAAAPAASADGVGGAGADTRLDNAVAAASVDKASFELDRLLDSATQKQTAFALESNGAGEGDGRSAVHLSRALAGLKSETSLHPFQAEGVRWMAQKEAEPDRLSLHPAWVQLQLPRGHLAYLHTWTGELSERFFSAPRAGTAGGMLCDDVGLGKSLQLLGLVLANPPPGGWAVDRLPHRTRDVLPIKATLVVAPAALIPQWEAEVRKHCREGVLRFCTYLGLGGVAAPKPTAAGASTTDANANVASTTLGVRPKRYRRSTPPVVDDADVSSGSTDEDEVEVLAATLPHLFAGDGGVGTRVEECDIVFCSFECLRDDLRKMNRAEGGKDLPLGPLGFWRVILDEAQLVAQTTSKAALMCSELWRRHAWVATGTPINAKLTELTGLLAFLGTRPFVDAHALHRLLLNEYKEREPHALWRMRTLLRALMLRRSQSDPAVQAQISLPPLSWETRTLRLSHFERGKYAVALQQLRRSHAAYARAARRTANRDTQPRAAHAHAARGNLKSRLLGQLNGDLTRLRQIVCHPSVVNSARPSQNSGGGSRLPHDVILQRLVAKAATSRDAAEAAYLRARAALQVTKAALGNRAGRDDDDDDLLSEVGRLVKRGAAERKALSDALALGELSSSSERWPRLRVELQDLLWSEKAAMPSSLEVALETCGGSRTRNKRRREATEEGAASGALRQSSRRGRLSCATSEQGGSGSIDGAVEEGGSTAGSRNGRIAGRGKVNADSGPNFGLWSAGSVVSATLAEAKRAVAKAAAFARERTSAHAYLCQLREPEAQGGGSSRQAGSSHSPQRADECAAASAADEADADGEEYADEGEGEGVSQPPVQTCPICLEQRGASVWSVTACGHHGCYECMETALSESRACPCCKRSLTLEMLYEIEADASVMAEAPISAGTEAFTAAPEAADALATAEYGTKVSALLSEVGTLAAAGERVVIFSAWTRLLKLADEALTAHGLPTASLVGSPAAKRTALIAFAKGVTEGGAAALLVPLFGGASGAGGGGAAGLTLTQARNAFLLEPALQPGIERQAAGRIARIGQTCPTRCVRLIVEETIETKILEWQQIRLADGASANPQLSLNDFVQLVGEA